MAKWMDFEKCPRCAWDIGTGEGERGCAWGDCPYLPEELDVFCAPCRFDFFTLEGNSACENPMSCEHGAIPLSNVENYRRWAQAHGRRIPRP